MDLKSKAYEECLMKTFCEDLPSFVPAEVLHKIIEENIEGRIDFKKLKNVVSKIFQTVVKTRDSGGYIYRGLKIKGSNLPLATSLPALPYKDSAQQSQKDLIAQLESKVKVLEEQLNDQAKHVAALKTKAQALEAETETLKGHTRKMEEEILQLKNKAQALEALTETLRDHTRKLEEQKARLEVKVRKYDMNWQKQQLQQRKLVNNQVDHLSSVNLIDSSDLLSYREDGEEIKLGEGTFGQCKLKTFTRTGTLVVCKELKSALSDKMATVKEAQVMQELTHRTFPFVFGVQLQERPYSIVLQFLRCKGDTNASATLAEIFDNISVTARNVREEMTKPDWKLFAEDLADALHHLHSKHLLHNDLKSDNVMISEKRAYIIDLGKACTQSHPPAKKYTKVYKHIAPEVLNGRPCSEESDIYSLGRIFYKMRKLLGLEFLKNIVKDCTHENHIMRPSSSILIAELRKLCV